MLSKNDIKYLRSLGQSKFREVNGQFIAEGSKVINEFHEEGWPLVRLYATEHNGLAADLQPQVVSEKELSRISQLNNPQDALAVLEIRPGKVHHEVSGLDSLVILCDHIQDPGNMGTIIRTADWFGFQQVVCSPDCADAYAPKVIQASMGSMARINVEKQDLMEFIKEMREAGCEHQVIVSSLEGHILYNQALPAKCFLVLGNESKGVSQDIVDIKDGSVKIPAAGGAESLNVAVSTGIMLAEYRRLNPRM